MYHVFREFVEIEGEEFPTYSIVAPNGYTVHDVTPDMKEAYRLANTFTDQRLAPVHLRDACEDYLAQ